MRIALVHMRHAAIGGTEQILDQLSRRLAERGHEVWILCRSHVAASHPSVRFVVLKSAVVGSAWRMWRFAADVERHVRKTRYDLVFALGKTWTHDVVRTSGGSHETWVERMRLAGGGSWRDSSLFRGLKKQLALAIERRAYAPGAYLRVIANSRLARDDMCRRHAVPLDAVDVVYNGVDLERFHPRPPAETQAWRRALSIGEGQIVFLFLGTGFGRKGLERTLRGFAEMAPRRPESCLVVAGLDSNQARYERLAAELSIANRVRFLGERRDADLCLAACDVHVLPTWFDSFAFTVLEALASGKPVITTDGAGAAELLDPGVHGEVLAWDCGAEALARAMLTWCDRDRLRDASGPARARAERCGFDTTMTQMTDILERVEENRRHSMDSPEYAT